MKIHNCTQGNGEWLALRAGRVTASEFGQVVTDKFELRTGDTFRTYLHKKLAEKVLGHPLQTFQSGDMEQGEIREDEALPWFEFTFNCDVRRVGFIETDDGRAGCSPDGLLNDGGLEIKCPQPHTHVGYLLRNELPATYRAQVHFSMFVTGAPWWKFVSYCRKFPPLLLTVRRDEKIQQAIGVALKEFYACFDNALPHLRSDAALTEK